MDELVSKNLYEFSSKIISDSGYIYQQMKRDLKYDDTKTKAEREVILGKEGVEAVNKLFAIAPDELNRLRKRRYSCIVQKACIKAFPDDKNKHCVFHDLRHSYAIALLSAGLPFSQVAQLLGNSVTVCDRYYTGFKLPAISRDLVRNILKSS